MASPATAGRANVLDNFLPPCPTLEEPTSFKKWSDPATWGNGPIPGQGAAAGANVTIACGEAVLLDTSPVALTLLNIRGFLRVLDSPALPKIDLSAAFIVVQGNLSIGRPQQHFQQRIKITLTPNPNNRADYLFTENLPAEPAFPRNLGHKAFAVVGGQVDLHGMPGGSSTPAWTKLTATAQPNDLVITVQDDVTAWPLDAFVVVTSTDYFPDQAEVVGIIDVVALPSGGSKIFLEKPLRLNHFGDPKGVPTGSGGSSTSGQKWPCSPAPSPSQARTSRHRTTARAGTSWFFMSRTPQFIEGVEFAQMGQQGKLGRYNIHFHVCGDDQGRSVVRKNVMHDSKQRCVVVHTTFNLTVQENVRTTRGGTASWWRRVGRLTTPSCATWASGPGQTEETDDRPSTFWITNPNNNLIGNVAAGSEDSGYWMELRDRVRGFTLSYPGLNATVPANGPFGIYATTWPTATGDRGGARTPRGSGPGRRGLWTRHFLSGSGSLPRGPSVGCCSTSKLETGEFFMHNSDGIIITNSTFADNRQGLNLLGNTGVRVTDSRFVGLSPNYGNPRNCDSTPQMCGPVTGCEFPLAPGQQGRSQGWSHWKNPLFGIIIDQPTFGFDFSRAHAISNCRFHAFDSTCRPAAAIGTGINGAPKDTWATATSIAAVQGTDSTNLLFFPPRNFTFPGGDVNGGSEATDLYTLWDRDGSFLNASLGGYLVANNSALLPPTKRFPACRPVPAWNAYACPGTCYRTVMFTYLEPGFSVYENSSVPDTRKRGDFR
ncbi:hypothetical protein CLOP_g11076 [Closterium sp. NIES-67]|nr:hypothetical protein CLOP_g11076 [Closterium sp. NIES-67]